MTNTVSSLLISTAELADNLGDPNWVMCDCRHDLMDPEKGKRAYAETHIAGALFLHLDADLSGTKTGRNGRHPLPDAAKLAAKLGQLGIDRSKQVVAYDDAGGAYAARLWWLLRWLGHDSVAVLDGGITSWIEEGRALTRELPPSRQSNCIAHPRDEMIVHAGFLMAQLGKPTTLVIDARAPERFRGVTEPIDPVAGHIPGAINRFFKDNLDAEGRFRPAEQLRRDFLALIGARSPQAVVNQCGSGVTACHNLLAMELAGLTGSRLYPGSWSEWCADPERPVARG